MEMMHVRIPAGISPGDGFRVKIGRQDTAVTCPPGAVPGSMVQIPIPDEKHEDEEGEEDPRHVRRPIWKSGELELLRVSKKLNCLSENRVDFVRDRIIDVRREILKREDGIKAELRETYVHAPCSTIVAPAVSVRKERVSMSD